MKIKVQFALIFALCSAFSLHAQETKYGLIAGVGFPSFSFSSIYDSKCEIESSAISAFHINGFVSFKSDSWWEISLEPGFNQKGGRVNFTYRHESGLINNINARKKYNTMELPVLFNSYLSSKLYLSTGLNVILFSSYEYEQDWTASKPNNSTANTISVQNLLPTNEKRLNCAGIIGLSYQLTDLLDISARYQIGLTKILHVDLLSSLITNVNLPIAYTTITCNELQLSLKYKIN